MRVLLVGALRAETGALLGLLGRPRRAGPRLLVGRRGELGLLTCGVGPRRAGERTAAALAIWPADVVISVGTCGALSDGPSIGEVFTADRLAPDGGEEIPVSPLAGIAAAAMVTVSSPVWDPGRRAELAAEGWALCEMEAAAVAAAAGAARFHAVKVVSDRAGAEGAPLRRRDLLRFQIRAARLVARHLAPALGL